MRPFANAQYKTAKSALKEIANALKETSDDAPMIRFEINNYTDGLCRDLPLSLTEKEREEISKKLHDLAASLHP